MYVAVPEAYRRRARGYFVTVAGQLPTLMFSMICMSNVSTSSYAMLTTFDSPFTVNVPTERSTSGEQSKHCRQNPSR